jgi:hypothetical protein
VFFVLLFLWAPPPPPPPPPAPPPPPPPPPHLATPDDEIAHRLVEPWDRTPAELHPPQRVRRRAAITERPCATER